MEKRDFLVDDVSNQSFNKEYWDSAWVVLHDRVVTRFLNPIKWILDKDHNKGEGFSAVALQCILIEFLEALYQGKVYTTANEGNAYDFEYHSSKDMISSFLRNRQPFSQFFDSNKKTASFYGNVRCGLLHEAATKGAVRIRKGGSGNKLVLFENGKPDQMILFRSNFQEALEEWFKNYKAELYSNEVLRINFIRKMDDICGIEHALYFAFGSNMSSERFRERVGKYHRIFPAKLEGYEFVYNKKSVDGSAKANLLECAESQVHGVCYEIDKTDLQKLRKVEKGYDETKVLISSPQSKLEFKAITFISKSLTSENPTQEYKRIVLAGAKEWGIDRSYVRNYLN